MAFPHSHKTVLVLDRSPHFLQSSKECVEFDVFSKSRTTGIIPLAPITKTLWTCCVEAVVEYARIVYDIYPTNKLLRFVVTDSSAHVLNSWAQNEQNLQQLMVSLAQIGPPSLDASGSNDGSDYNIIHGLTQAIQLLCEPSHTQHAVRTSLTESATAARNCGRIICLTNITSDNHARVLEEFIQEALTQHNKMAASSDNLMPISHCELVLVHTMQFGEESLQTGRQPTEISNLLTSEVHVTESGHFVSSKLVELAIKHYDLSSTTVTGIPMKEEQNASSSANYDVELLHHERAHVDICHTGEHAIQAPGPDDIGASTRQPTHANTVTLKWCTPKSNAVELHQCGGAFRITPVDVNSRPSSCLTNFLLKGRAVMLEQPRKSGVKVISHMLASHGGEIYIHALLTMRSILEDPPSISEGCGGRVTDYRINDFGELMKDSRLAPVAVVTAGDQLPFTRAKAQLERFTRYWPMVISYTIIFNMLSHLDPLPTLITKERIDEEELLECKKAIYHIVLMESRNEALPIPAIGARGKGPKREEQYRQMWAELEKFVRAHSDTSPMHEKILECLLECKKPSESSSSPKKSKKEKEAGSPAKEECPPTPDPTTPWKELDKYSRLTEREKSELNKGDSPVLKRPRQSMEHNPIKAPGGESLLSLWMTAARSSHRPEFAGRLESSGPQAELYMDLGDDMGDPPDNGEVGGKNGGKKKSRID